MKKTNSKLIKVVLKKSVSGSTERQRNTVAGLGLGKLNSSRTLKDSPSVRGMISKVSHLVEVEPYHRVEPA